MRPNRKVMLRVGTIKIFAGSVSSYQRAERWDEPRFLSVHVSLMKSWLSCAPASTSSEYIYFTPKRLLLLRAGGGSWWSYRAAHPSDYIPAGGPVFGPHFSSMWYAVYLPRSYSCSVTLLGKLLNSLGRWEAQHPTASARIIFSWEPLSERGSIILSYLAG